MIKTKEIIVFLGIALILIFILFNSFTLNKAIYCNKQSYIEIELIDYSQTFGPYCQEIKEIISNKELPNYIYAREDIRYIITCSDTLLNRFEDKIKEEPFYTYKELEGDKFILENYTYVSYESKERVANYKDYIAFYNQNCGGDL